MPTGASVAPVIIATDKTQLTQFSGNKSAYPVYLTLGNIPRSIRRRPSQQACILIGYLSVSKIRGANLTTQEKASRVQRLFHESLRIILEPLKKAGKDGVEMVGGDGKVRRVHPILAAYVADYPEQCLVTCSKYGTCPICQCPASELQEKNPGDPRSSSWTLKVMEESRASTSTRSAYARSCMDKDVSGGVSTPFWIGFPFCDINSCITPDILHQLYQGVFKHIVTWCQELMDPAELDARIRCLPPYYGLRHFKNGISALSQVSGTERKHMARVLLGCLIGQVPKGVVLAIRSLLDFIYLAQYPTHNDTTLGYMEKALDVFHRNKKIFIELGIREHINIPKFHSLLHYVQSIRKFGTTDNYNTEMFERFHIDFAKEGWRASNKRDERPQMILWLSRQEKVNAFESYLKDGNEETLQGTGPAPGVLKTKASEFQIKIAKKPPCPRQSLSSIQQLHNAPGFSRALKEYINSLQPPGASRVSRSALPAGVLPFSSLAVYHNFKFHKVELGHTDLLSSEDKDKDVVKAYPASSKRAARFDTVIVLTTEDAESTGVAGAFLLNSKLRVMNYHNNMMIQALEWVE